jgi:hypothetical protein
MLGSDRKGPVDGELGAISSLRAKLAEVGFE